MFDFEGAKEVFGKPYYRRGDGIALSLDPDVFSVFWGFVLGLQLAAAAGGTSLLWIIISWPVCSIIIRSILWVLGKIIFGPFRLIEKMRARGSNNIQETKNKIIGENRVDEAKRTCPICGHRLEVIRGRHGPFWGCTGYRINKCKYTKNINTTKVNQRNAA